MLLSFNFFSRTYFYVQFLSEDLSDTLAETGVPTRTICKGLMVS